MSTFSWRVLRLPLLITLLWGLLLFTLFRWTAQREDEYTTGLARIQTATLFSSIVDTRDWNANNGGVWGREHPGCPANPWLPEEERTLRAEDGITLVKVNPAYMTRQIAESFTSTLASFRISSLSPKRPENRADQWETGALLSFEKDRHELFDLVSDKEGMRYRYMAALPAKESCIQCHQDKKVGDVLGGISVSISAEPLFEAATERKRTTGLAFGIIGIIGMVGIGGGTVRKHRQKGGLPQPPQPHQERLPRQHDPRYAYPADRHPRHDRTAGTRNAGFASPLSARQPPEGHRQPAYGRRRHHALFPA